MAAPESQSMSIVIGEQTFRVKVSPEERERYAQAAATAGQVYRAVAGGVGLEGPRALAMALFQLAVELGEAQTELKRAQATRDRLSRLIERIDRVTDPGPVQGRAAPGEREPD